jgi:hypothetical protein
METVGGQIGRRAVDFAQDPFVSSLGRSGEQVGIEALGEASVTSIRDHHQSQSR